CVRVVTLSLLVLLFGSVLWKLPQGQAAAVREMKVRIDLESKSRQTMAQIVGGAEALLSEYKADSDISKINTNAGAEQPVSAAPETITLLTKGKQVAALTSGAFSLTRVAPPPSCGPAATSAARRWRGALRATPWPGVCQGGQGGRADPRRGHQREQGGRGWADAGRWDCVKSGFIFQRSAQRLG